MMNSPACTGSGDPSKCITVPANSAGYVKIRLNPYHDPPDEPGGKVAEQNKTFNIYPNPANTQITITTDCNYVDCAEEPSDIKIYNVQGKLCMQTQIMESGVIDIKMLSVGIYQVVISDKNTLVTKTLVKQ